MILGIGQDTVDIRRIERTLNNHGDRFIHRVFTEGEIAKAKSRSLDGKNNSQAATYAKRFAAKEACAKAMGTGIGSGVYWKDFEVVNLPSGKPTMRLSDRAMKLIRQYIYQGEGEIIIHLTLGDEYPNATALVILEQR